jgi:hypothetical protein
MKIYALSLWQPWATWIAQGKKTVETRSWKTNQRRPLLICAAKKVDPNFRIEALSMPIGKAVAIANLKDCRLMKKSDEKAAMCEWYPGAYAWVLDLIYQIEPFPVVGRQGIFKVEIGDALYEQFKGKREAR